MHRRWAVPRASVVSAMLASGCVVSMAQGEGYHFAVPAGYSVRSNADLHLPDRALAIAQDRRTEDDYFIASMVVTSIAPSDPPFDITSPTLCAAAAEALGKRENATVLQSGIVSIGLGRTCQFDLKSNLSKQGVRFTVMPGPHALWALTCNHDPRDTEAVHACQQVIDGWQFE